MLLILFLYLSDHKPESIFLNSIDSGKSVYWLGWDLNISPAVSLACSLSAIVQSARTFLVSPTTNHPNHQGFPGGSAGKESPCNAEDLGLIPGLGRSPGGGHGNPLQYSCLENLHGQRNLEGCRSWGGKESDTTERHSTTTPLQLASSKHFFFWPKTPGNMSLFTSPSCLGHRAQVTLKTVYRRRILRVLWIWSRVLDQTSPS